jgi:hypothetical protein
LGELVEAGVVFPMPGRKKLAGETLYEPLTPPQPATTNIVAAATVTRSIFQFNFTLTVCCAPNMRATIKYPVSDRFLANALGRKTGLKPSTPRMLKRELLTIFLLPLLILNSTAQVADFTAEAKAAYEAAQNAYSTNNSSSDAAINLARTAFDYADLAPNDQIRETVANHGIATAKLAISANTNSVAAHYYLALNIGQLARTKMLGALKLLTDMEQELKTVIRLDPKYDYAGGDRTIGVLYAEAPGFSVGDKSKAKIHLAKAVELAPEFPDNHLCYLEAIAKWKDWKLLTEKLADYRATVPKAKEKFTGPEWGYEWHDWTRREKVIQQKLQKR